MKSRWIAGLTALAVSAGLLAAGAPAAHASSKGRLNTTYALGAAALYELATGKTGPGLLLGLGTAYAYKRYSDAHRAERRRYYYYPSRYYSSRYRYRSYRHHSYRYR
jgi:transketolase N-terminal domain/subunit